MQPVKHALRFGLLGLAMLFVSTPNNPIVQLQATLGLSPCPTERLGWKCLFCGMTEGMFQLARGDLMAAMRANVLTPLFAALAGSMLVAGYRPRVETRSQEWLCFVAIAAISVVVNLAPVR